MIGNRKMSRSLNDDRFIGVLLFVDVLSIVALTFIFGRIVDGTRAEVALPLFVFVAGLLTFLIRSNGRPKILQDAVRGLVRICLRD